LNGRGVEEIAEKRTYLQGPDVRNAQSGAWFMSGRHLQPKGDKTLDKGMTISENCPTNRHVPRWRSQNVGTIMSGTKSQAFERFDLLVELLFSNCCGRYNLHRDDRGHDNTDHCTYPSCNHHS
jgi:hypothetical protein